VRQVVTAHDVVVEPGPRDVLADLVNDEDIQSIKENARLQALDFRLQRDFLLLDAMGMMPVCEAMV
jgi:SAM-dependent MidA family methyltransferase